MSKLKIRPSIPTNREVDADLAELFRVVDEHPDAKNLRACGYIRKSKFSEIDPDQSLPGQAKRIQELAEENGWQLVSIFKDPGYSGRYAKRPGLQALQRAIKKGQVTILIIDRLDRLSRNLINLLQLLKLCHDHGVTLYSVRERIDFSKSWGRLVLYVLGALAEFYTQALSEEMHLLHQHRAQQGQLSSAARFGYCNGRCSKCTDLNGPDYCPYADGEDRHDGQFRIPHPIEAVAVRLAFEWYATGKYSDADIARQLNTELCTLEDGTEVSFRTKGRPGVRSKEPDTETQNTLWQDQADEVAATEDAAPLRYPPGDFNRDTVRAILTNPVYAGYVTYYSTYENGLRNGKPLKGKKHKKPVAVYEGKHEALVPLSLYRRVQTIRRNRYHRTTGQRHPARTYPLTGILFCEAAQSPLRGISSNGGKQRYYVDKLCQQRLARELWHQKNLRADILEQQVADRVTQMTLPDTWRERILAYVIYEEGTDEIENAKLALRGRLQRAKKLYEFHDYDWQEFERVRRECRAQLVALAPATSAASHEVTALLDNLPALWTSLTDDELKTLYRHIFSAIYVNDAGIAKIKPRQAFIELLGKV